MITKNKGKFTKSIQFDTELGSKSGLFQTTEDDETSKTGSSKTLKFIEEVGKITAGVAGIVTGADGIKKTMKPHSKKDGDKVTENESLVLGIVDSYNLSSKEGFEKFRKDVDTIWDKKIGEGEGKISEKKVNEALQDKRAASKLIGLGFTEQEASLLSEAYTLEQCAAKDKGLDKNRAEGYIDEYTRAAIVKIVKDNKMEDLKLEDTKEVKAPKKEDGVETKTNQL